MSLTNFINKYINKYEKVDHIIDKCTSRSKKGFVYERLWDLVFKFGLHAEFSNKDYNHIIGNINDGIPIILSSLKNYTNDNCVISGNSGGYSDITLQNKNTKQYIFITCKYFEKEKDIINYGTNDIVSMAKKNNKIYKIYDIRTLVKNKNKLLDKVNNANSSSDCIKTYLSEDKIFDETDLEKYYHKLKSKLEKIDIINKLGYENVSDKKLIERTEFEANMNKVIKELELFTNPHLINPLFGLNKKVNKVDSIKSFLGFINSLFNEFGFNIKVKQKNIKENKKVNKKNYYYIKYVNEVDKFI